MKNSWSFAALQFCTIRFLTALIISKIQFKKVPNFVFSINIMIVTFSKQRLTDYNFALCTKFL